MRVPRHLLALASLLLGALGVSHARSDDVDARIQRAIELEKAGDISAGAHVLREVLAERPDHAGARGLLGQARYKGVWLRPDEIVGQLDQDSAERANLEAYEARRACSADTVEGHLQLASWCRNLGLKLQEKAHLRAITKL